MKISDLTVEVRDASLARVGLLLPADLVGFKAVLRYNNIGSWEVTLPVGHRMAEYLRQPGSGLIISTDSGTLLSGPTTSVVTSQSTDDQTGTYTISGVDDTILLKERLAYPTPATADVTAQTSASDVRTGAAETVMKGFVNANIGPGAPTVRRVSGLTIQTDQARGVNVTSSARFETLQELLSPIADLAGLGYTIEQVGSGLEFQVFQPTDRSGTVRLDLDNGRLTRSEYSYSQPLATRTIVGGGGEGTARVFVERSSSTSIDAEKVWGRRIEVFNNSSGTDTAQLEQDGDEQLAKDGKTLISVSISPSDDQTMLFGVDWSLGDKVTCVVGTTQLTSIVTEVGLLISADGVRLGATVGEPRSLDYETQLLTKQADQATRISKLERAK